MSAVHRVSWGMPGDKRLVSCDVGEGGGTVKRPSLKVMLKTGLWGGEAVAGSRSGFCIVSY